MKHQSNLRWMNGGMGGEHHKPLIYQSFPFSKNYKNAKQKLPDFISFLFLTALLTPDITAPSGLGNSPNALPTGLSP